ncbi:MAG: flippase-like domain-containing protein [Prevotellaceae bacterium]|jgi:uncharacterized protein (TIRG00374 family)|nr:flippase-like domain-containing protein [Prevotellaceae bacterium]
MRHKITSAIYYAFFFGLAIAAMYYCFKNVKFADLVFQLKEANYFLIALSLIFGMIAYLVRALRWQILIKPLGHKPSLYHVYNAVMLGYLANLVVPRIGEVTRCAILNKTDKIPGDSLFGTVVVERVVDLISLFVLTIFVFFLRMDFFSRFVSERIILPLSSSSYNVSGGAIAIICSVVVCLSTLTVLFWKRIVNTSFAKKIRMLLRGIFAGLKTIFKMERHISFIIYTITIWTCFWMMSYCIAEAMPTTAWLDPIDSLFLMALGSMGWVVPVPGGMGSFHTLIAWGLMMYGLSFKEGVVFATISHESQIIIMIVLGLISLISVSLISGKKVRIINVHTHE